MKNIQFYTLLFYEEKRDSLIQNFGAKEQNINDKNNSIKDFMVYINCCKVLSDSLKKRGFNLTVLTNNKEIIKENCEALQVKEIPFELNVPPNIEFYGAHHKIDVYKWFSNQKDDYSVLLDIDVFCANEMPPNFINAVNKNIPLFYDITEQAYPAATRERIIKDKSILNPNANLGLWAGGEFIAGDGEFFGKLHNKILSFIDLYFKNYKTFFHQGDEMLTSTAIELLQSEGVFIANAASFGAIRRFWSVGTKHCQLLYLAVKDAFLLHVPADKSFMAQNEYSDDYMQKYEKYLRQTQTLDTTKQIPRLFSSRLKNKIKRFLHV